MFLRKNITLLTILLLSILIISFTTSISAQETVKVGLLGPMTGPNAATGQIVSNAGKFAVDIINGEFPDLASDLGAGLPNLKGAKIELIIADSQGEPEFGATQAERLITLSGVVALLGDQASGVTKTESRVAERYQTSYVNACSSSPDLTERGFKYFFRVGVNDTQFAELYMNYFKDINRTKNANIKTIGYICENSEFGISTGKAVANAAKSHGFNMVSNIIFPVSTADLDSEVLILKKDQPDFVLASVLASDFLLLVSTAKKLDYNPPGIGGFGGGFYESIGKIGKDGEGFTSRDIFSLDLANKIPLLSKVNQIFKERYGYDFNGDSIREFTGMMVIADAINRAGSTDKEAIWKALTETNIPADQLIVYWDGIKFNEKGQNILCQGIVRQMINGEYRVVWPLDIASEEIVYPMKKWSEK